MKTKKILIYLTLFSLILTACSKPKAKDVSVDKVLEKLATNAEISSPKYLDLTKQENAETYLLSTDDFTEGKVVYSESTQQADKIILIKAKDTKTVQDIERSLSSVLVGLTTTWESNPEEAEKVEEHILKTKDTYVLLYVGENNEEAEKIFDESI